MIPHVSVARTLRPILGWILLALFVGMIALWSVFGAVPSLAEHAPAPLSAFGQVSEFWPIFAGFVAGGGAAWALAPGLTIRGEEEGERRINLSPLVAAILGPSSLILMFAAYWPCTGEENQIWASLRLALEALEGYVAEPFGVVEGCSPEFPQGLMAGILFGRTTLVLVIGLGFAFVFRRSIDTIKVRFASQIVVFSGLDSETAASARAVKGSLTDRQRLVVLQAGDGAEGARELAREIGVILLSIDVSDDLAIEAFMRARGRRGIQGLHLMSPDTVVNRRAMDEFLRCQDALVPTNDSVASHSDDLTRRISERAASQTTLLEAAADSTSWRAPRQQSGLEPRGFATRTEIPGRVVVRIDNPWHAEDWRQRQMTARADWLFDAISINEVAARHVVRQAKIEGIDELVLLGSSPFELAVLAEVAFEHRVDKALEAASSLGRERRAESDPYVSSTPTILLHGEESREAEKHFQHQLQRFGITDADHHIRTAQGSIEDLMNHRTLKRALLMSNDDGNDATFLAARHPRWRIFDWSPQARGLMAEPVLGRMSMIGPTLEPVEGEGVDIWERLARIKHEIYLYHWRGGKPEAGDPNRGNWDRDLDAFARESNIRSFATFCKSIAGLGRQWATDLGEDGLQTESPLGDDDITRAAIEEHDSWVRHHVEYKWRLGDSRAGGTSDRTRAKLHPDIVEWDALSPDEKQKDLDSLTGTIALMRSLGFFLVKSEPAQS